jgi:hypothetical protein
MLGFLAFAEYLSPAAAAGAAPSVQPRVVPATMPYPPIDVLTTAAAITRAAPATPARALPYRIPVPEAWRPPLDVIMGTPVILRAAPAASPPRAPQYRIPVPVDAWRPPLELLTVSALVIDPAPAAPPGLVRITTVNVPADPWLFIAQYLASLDPAILAAPIDLTPLPTKPLVIDAPFPPIQLGIPLTVRAPIPASPPTPFRPFVLVATGDPPPMSYVVAPIARAAPIVGRALAFRPGSPVAELPPWLGRDPQLQPLLVRGRMTVGPTGAVTFDITLEPLVAFDATLDPLAAFDVTLDPQ